MRLKRQAVVLLALVLALTLAGLTGSAQGQAVKNPDTLVVVRFGDPESLDPAYAYDTASSEIILWHVYETLIMFNGSSTSQFVPMLATQVPSIANGGISRDGKTYTFTLREGVKFHDGSPLTAEDVKYSLLRFMFMDRDGGPSWILLEPILGAAEGATHGEKGIPLFNQASRAIQTKGNTISITLKDPFAAFLPIMAMWSMTLSKSWMISQGGWNGTAAQLSRLNNPAKPEDTTLFSKGNGTGPFRLVQWDKQGRQAILERNPTYWRAPAKLQRIVLRVVEEFGPRRLMLQQGDADLISVNRPEQTQVEGLQGVRIVDGLSQLVVTGIYMNTKIDVAGGNPDVGSGRLDGNGVPPDFFADVNVRRGIAQAFDYQTAVRDCYRNAASVVPGPIPRGLLGYHSNLRWYNFDRERATAAFREAAGGQIWNNGFRFTVAFNSGNTARQCVAQVLKSGIESLNPKFRVEARGVTWAQYLQLYRQSKLPMWIIGWAADYPDPDNFVVPFQHSTGTYAAAQGYKNAEVDQLIAQAKNEVDVAKRRALYFKLEEIAMRDATTLYLQTVGFQVMRSWIKGWYHNPAFFAPYFYPMSKG